eukprot:GHVU01231609.1.p1 GENE.GHVU01231609.1~~GHVU01231609.1.p1  ORF type:complete len:145 (+),score=12.90 GHVU01231609.1:396-830(+)
MSWCMAFLVYSRELLPSVYCLCYAYNLSNPGIESTDSTAWLTKDSPLAGLFARTDRTSPEEDTRYVVCHQWSPDKERIERIFHVFRYNNEGRADDQVIPKTVSDLVKDLNDPEYTSVDSQWIASHSKLANLADICIGKKQETTK